MRKIAIPVALVTIAFLAASYGAAGTSSRVRHIDADGDGRTDVFETLDGDVVIRTVSAPAPGSNPPKTLVLAIDAIPYEVFAELQQEGLFKAFFPVSRMLAPYPSLTNVGYTAILRTAPSVSYEDRFFDPEANLMGGGMWARAANEYKSIAPFHEVFDWEQPHLWGAFVFFTPGRISEAELVGIEKQLKENDKDELALYIGSTDAFGHVRGRPALKEHLRKVEQVIENFLAEGGGERRVVLFSDHGMSTVPSRLVDLEGTLEANGFQLTEQIDRPTDVVTPAYGLVGSIQLYTVCGMEEEVARAVVNAEGVDFAVWRDGNSVGAVDPEGSSDPLDRPEAEYPQLRRRVEEGVRNHTLRPGSVFVSLEDGWHYGSELFDKLVKMVGTHGSARATSSVGFVASNVDHMPEWVPAEEVFPYLGLSHAPQPSVELTDVCLAGLNLADIEAAPEIGQ